MSRFLGVYVQPKLTGLTIPMTPSIYIFGEVLIDRFEDGSKILGGAPFNVAWHLQGLGFTPILISRIGQDDSGTRIRRAMRNWKMVETELQTDAEHATGTVAVNLINGEPSYAILEQQAYDYIDINQVPVLTANSVLYHGTLAARHSVSNRTLQSLRLKHQGPRFIDVNLRTPWLNKSQVLKWIYRAEWVKLNEAELWALQDSPTTLEQAMRQFKRQHEIPRMIVTKGELGSWALDENDELFKTTPKHNVKVIDTVGAGDAFAAGCIAGLVKDWSMTQIMEYSQQLASALVGVRGATIDQHEFYQQFAVN